MQASEERQRKKQKRKADEGQLAAKRQEMDKAKVSGFADHCTLAHSPRTRAAFLDCYPKNVALLWDVARAGCMRRHVLRGVMVLV